MELKEMRVAIDEIDTQIVELISRRMDVVREVAKYKSERNLPIFDPQREREKLAVLETQAGDELAGAV